MLKVAQVLQIQTNSSSYELSPWANGGDFLKPNWDAE